MNAEKVKLANCLELQKKAARIIPGMTQLLSKRPDLFSRGVWPTYFKKAQGIEVVDLDGNRYLDFSIGGIGATVLGYADPDVNRAVMEVIADGSASSLNPPEEVALAEKLIELHPWAQMARFARSGGEAMAVAVRIVRAATGKDVIVFCGYHGWMDWYLAANLGTENALGEHLIPGLLPTGVPRCLAGTALPFHYNDIPSLKSAVEQAGDNLAAVVMEPIRNYMPEADFMAEVQEVCRRRRIPLVMDEISAGFRLCSGGAHLKLGWQPDIAVFSKALGNGFPIAAVIGREQFMAAAQKSFITSTNWTERTGPAAALAMIEKFIANDVSSHLQETGRMVAEGWRKLAEKHGLDLSIGGILPMLHFTFAEDHNVRRAFFTQEMLKRGFLAGMQFYSMYAHTPEAVEAYLNAVDEVWGELASLIRGNRVAAALEGAPAVSGFQRIN